MHRTDPLFTPVPLLRKVARNRLAMPAFHLGLAQDGAPSEELIEFYGRRAQGGVAVITVGVCNTWHNPVALGLSGDLDLSEDRHVGAFERLARRVKDHGAMVGAQLSPLTGYNNPAWWPAASEVREIVRSFADAANRARAAGFDFVELMLSGGSLLSHFASTAFNQGALPLYAGDFDGRVRLSREVIAAIRHATSDELPIAARLHGHELLEDGYGVAGAACLARALADAGVEAVSVTGAGHRTVVPQLLPETPPLVFAYLARAVATAVACPVSCGGRVRLPREARRALEVSGAAMVNLGRALLVDPDWPVKAQEDRDQDIAPCMACGVCLDRVFAKQPVRCPLQPELGRRDLPALPPGITPLERRSRVMVVGAGPAGLRASLTLAETGHEVELVEQANHPGGRWNVASKVHGRADLRLGLEAVLAAAKHLGVRLMLDQTASPELVRSSDADALVLATGSRPRRPDIRGLERHPHVLWAEEAILNPQLVGATAVILGGGGVGVETAVHLARQHELPDELLGYIARKSGAAFVEELRRLGSGRKLTVVRRRGYVGKGLGRSLRWALVADLERLGVEIVDRCAYEEVTEQGVVVLRGATKERVLLKADTLILAAGQEVPPGLVDTWANSAQRVLAVGDATGIIGNLGDAMLRAHELMLALGGPGRETKQRGNTER